MAAIEIDNASTGSHRRSSLAPSRPRKGRRSIEGMVSLSRRSVGGSSRHSLGASSVHSLMTNGSFSTHTNSGSNNPITNDANLNILVHDKLPTITKYKQFQRWKSKFIDRFDSYLTQSGMQPASAASQDLQIHLEACLRRASNVLEQIYNGNLSPIKRSVKASRALKEFCVSIEECRVELEELIPATQIDEKRKGYSKFHVGTSLIKAGFPQFVAMKELEESVSAMCDKTFDPNTEDDNLDKVERELFDLYMTQVSRFCDIMADLDLYDIMLQCVRFLTPPENEEGDDADELTIFVQRYHPQRDPSDHNLHRQNPSGNVIKEASSSHGTSSTDSVSEYDMEPSFRGDDEYAVVDSVPSPAPSMIKVDVEDSETIASVVAMVAEDLGFLLRSDVDIMEQLMVRCRSNDKVVPAPKTTTLKQLRIEDGDVLTLEEAKIPVTVLRNLLSGETIELAVWIDPLATVHDLKVAVEDQQLRKGDGMVSILVENQRLFLAGVELDDENRACSRYGIVSGSVLNLRARDVDVPVVDVLEGEDERIVIVDTKYGTMFSVGRDEVVAQKVLTPKIVNSDDVFLEATTKDIDKDRMREAMMCSPNLKVKPQIVIPKMKIEDYEIDTADDVKNMWGVELKKSRQKKRSSDLFFVDLKTRAVGFLNRTKLVEMGFITVVQASDPNVVSTETFNYTVETDTLEQAEKDQQKYDFFVFEIRKIFGIDFEESLGLQAGY
mmetsp:Transcript_11239/g.27001  ORF Transcript_11239/g.27001 Transcript_11239/m.27001 type:complete len:723 (-) Transcript_11239:211-2379(-)|eukprot:CAMPEP_0197191988 /NCGR_PEP_ID=MMETSP1423-20130617/24351_1 /TAXON_ID=476441 /ORGANISM="Pseudo-nitzschia heimii, Strain UNC1101" /LENGTH=722 /DNA_ID=CAMNT_0042644789 /DNA_START=227 /DNA_END=2395 /DNA_ORIENTATION=-